MHVRDEHVCMDTHACQKTALSVVLWEHHPPYFQTGTQQLGKVGWLGSKPGTCLAVFPVLGIQAHTTTCSLAFSGGTGAVERVLGLFAYKKKILY